LCFFVTHTHTLTLLTCPPQILHMDRKRKQTSAQEPPPRHQPDSDNEPSDPGPHPEIDRQANASPVFGPQGSRHRPKIPELDGSILDLKAYARLKLMLNYRAMEQREELQAALNMQLARSPHREEDPNPYAPIDIAHFLRRPPNERHPDKPW
jgi:hypothetical protein